CLFRSEPPRYGALRIFVHGWRVRLALPSLPAGSRAGALAMLRRQDRRDAQLHLRARRLRTLPVYFPRTRVGAASTARRDRVNEGAGHVSTAAAGRPERPAFTVPEFDERIIALA